MRTAERRRRAALRCGAWLCSMALGALAAPPTASAYCRTSHCPDCPRDADTGCTLGGAPLSWASSCVSFSVEELPSAYVDADTATRLMGEAFARWSEADCDGTGARPSIEVGVTSERVSCDDVGFNRGAGNANSVVFRDTAWPYEDAYRSLASTTVTSDASGVIHDADIEINTTQPIFIAGETTAGGVVGAHDLLSIMVHEAGHFLGLDHTRDDTAIMRAYLDPGEVRTSLSADDVVAICEAYPPERAAACDDTPEHGFSPDCAPSHDSGGCTVRAAPSAEGHVSLAALATMLGVLVCRRRRR